MTVICLCLFSVGVIGCTIAYSFKRTSLFLFFLKRLSQLYVRVCLCVGLRVYVWVMCMCVCACLSVCGYVHESAGDCGGQKHQIPLVTEA